MITRLIRTQFRSKSTLLCQTALVKQPLVRNLFTCNLDSKSKLQISAPNQVSKPSSSMKTVAALRASKTEKEEKKKKKIRKRILKIFRKKKPSPVDDGSDIPVVQLKEIEKLDKHPNHLLIDVREVAECDATGMIPTAINVPMKSIIRYLGPNSDPEFFQEKFGRPKPDYDSYIIISCLSGARAVKAAMVMEELGYSNVHVYKGSWKEYAQKHGLPL